MSRHQPMGTTSPVQETGLSLDQELGAPSTEHPASIRRIQKLNEDGLSRSCGKMERWNWDADEGFVDIDTIFTDLVWVKAKQEAESVGDHLEIFKHGNHDPASYIYVEGPAGSGKTTLVQMFGNKWCKFVQNPDELSPQEVDVLSRFKYVILIYLRLVHYGQSLLSAIEEQYGLTVAQGKALYNHVLINPGDTLFIFEGYDEYLERASPEITNVARRQIFQACTVLITSRHPPSFHFPDQDDRAHKPDNHVLLKGFSRSGVKQYVRRFFKDTEPSETFLNEISKSSELESLSQLPAILLLMCLLWSRRKSMGNSLTDFLRKFIGYVCSRFEVKFGRQSDRAESEDFIFDKYHDLLMKIGEVGVSGLREDTLHLSFSLKLVRETTGKAWDLGFLKKGLKGVDEVVEFPHKIIQEFFIAYYTVNCDEVKRRELLVRFCSSVKAVKESEMIQRFIAGLGGEKIKKEIDRIVTGTDDDRAVMYTALQLHYLAENPNAQIELPTQVYLVVKNTYTTETYTMFLSKDSSATRKLTVSAFKYQQNQIQTAVVPALYQLTSIVELIFLPRSLSGQALEELSRVLATDNLKLTRLDLEEAVGLRVKGAPWPSLIQSLPSSLELLNISGNDIGDAAVERLTQRFETLPRLQFLYMPDCNLGNADVILNMMKELNKCPTLRYISLTLNHLSDSIGQIVKLAPYMTTLRQLHLSHNGLSDHVRDRISDTFWEDLPELRLYV